MAGDGRGKKRQDNRAKWNHLHKTHLVKLLTEYNTFAYRTQNAWTKEAWNKMVRDMNTKFSNGNITLTQLKGLEQDMKKIYKLLKKFSELSGFGWDYKNHMVVAPDEVWKPLLERSKDARRWHKKPFPYFRALQELYEGKDVERKCSRGINDYVDSTRAPPHTPNANISAPGDSIHFLDTFEVKDEDGVQIEPACSQTLFPNLVSQPQSSSTSRPIGATSNEDQSSKKKTRKGKNVQERFLERYIAMRERETDRYINVLKENTIKETKEKYSIGSCIRTFNTMRDRFTEADMVKATRLFMKAREYREVFLCLDEDQKEPWLKTMLLSLDE